VHVLRTRHVCDGFRLDEAEAERALRYFRRVADGGREGGKEWRAAIGFLYGHGQSLDWVCFGDPGGMIAFGAATAWKSSDAAAAA
jgi:hypothetical protein